MQRAPKASLGVLAAACAHLGRAPRVSHTLTRPRGLLTEHSGVNAMLLRGAFKRDQSGSRSDQRGSRFPRGAHPFVPFTSGGRFSRVQKISIPIFSTFARGKRHIQANHTRCLSHGASKRLVPCTVSSVAGPAAAWQRGLSSRRVAFPPPLVEHAIRTHKNLPHVERADLFSIYIYPQVFSSGCPL